MQTEKRSVPVLSVAKIDFSVESQPDTAVRKTWFSGGTNAETLLREIGIDFQKCTAVPESGQIVVSSGTELSELTDAVENRAAFSGFAARLNEVPEFSGISNSDLHYRTELTFAGFTGGSNGGTAIQSIRIGK